MKAPLDPHHPHIRGLDRMVDSMCSSVLEIPGFLGMLPLEGAQGWSSGPDPLFQRWENLKFREDGD